MRQVPAALAVLAVLGFPALSLAQKTQDLPAFARDVPKIKSGDPVFAFNGKDLTGFSTFLKQHKHEDPDGVFTVKDGVIRVSGQEYGCFATKEEYGNYHLIVEWRWGGKTWPPRTDRARDSGVLVHSVGPDGAAGGVWMESVECQIIEGGCGDFILVGGKGHPEMSCVVRKGEKNQLYFDPSGEKVTRQSGRYNWWGRDPQWKDETGFRGSQDVEKPAGEWNRLEVVCDGDTVTNILNGVLVNQGTGSNRTKGKIQFQSEGAEILFRKIEVRPLLKP
jgi:hypothetical protein